MADRRDTRGPLRDLFGEHLDPGYAKAAERRRAGSGAGGAHDRHADRHADRLRDRLRVRHSGVVQGAWLVAGALLVGLVLGVAAEDAAARAPGAEQARRGLVEDVRQARERTDELSREAAELGDTRGQAQSEALTSNQRGRDALDELARLERGVAAVPVTGPGLRITVDDDREPDEQGHAILDRDLQVLVNGLWAAGAEAISMSGVRLHPRATIRQAGEAVLVDHRPVSQPYLLEVIGEPQNLHIRFLETDGYGRFATFTQVYGMRFEIEPVEELRLPAGSPAEPEVAR